MKLGNRKSKQANPTTLGSTEPAAATRLKELCGGDNEFYQAMSRLMFLDPKRISVPLERVLEEAQEYEGQGNKLRAEVGYRLAGGISLYRGDANGVSKYFSKAASYAGDTHPEYQVMVKRSNEAVDIAKKYYDEFGSTR